MKKVKIWSNYGRDAVVKHQPPVFHGGENAPEIFLEGCAVESWW
jgi:hypothetical protein